ncbi:ppx/GppA phosphatase family domain-containing protein [Trichoderma breve]|uniref:Ppx/GppA phosphatase family domain-containing protein n=1 Tax=Trichoderma breve TaxID=2034170 RepID=A0A9W9B7B8_9HYPO|nr:ppx/GppA phosphatase family domain-containing protein [Trichoderma breve]KAJ4857294.1 ppx/GppA phosphatase family domain-containing protein [Trichoderma breve]
MDIWGFEDLGIISDFEEEEEANGSCPGNLMKPSMPASHRDDDRPHPPWEGHRDKLVGIVDMGSNGIRFSITDLSAGLARILPTVLAYRSGISLYDSQYDPETGEQIPIPDDVIADVVTLFNRFLIVCHDMGVDKKNIHIVATEATRKALNSAQFIEVVKEKTGLSIEMLPKEIEGQIGALGIASGFTKLSGLVMDLGGGSTQITWMVSQGGHIRISPLGSFSFPYGAAALSRQLRDLRKGKKKDEGEEAVARFREEMIQKFRDAYDHLQIPETMIEKAKEQGGFRIYLSGGGFRGWGYLLLYLNQSHGKHYPISVINGYTVGREQFEDTDTVKQIAKAAKDVFRVSDRRRSQVPAVAFLVNVLAEAIPHGIREAHFCQGGVREGYLFRTLSPEVRELSPLSVATQNFAPTSYRTIQELLKSAIPKPSKNQTKRFPEEFGEHVIDSFANVMYVHMFMSKETASTTALYSTSVGIMSSTHGVSHQDRARLALMLESRYRGELPPREMEFREALRSLITPEEVWWTTYLGRVGYMITRLYPSGEIDTAKPRVVFSAEWSWTMGKKRNKEGLVLTLSVQKLKNDPAHLKKALEDNVKVIQKVGKKKRWIGKDDPWGMKVKVNVVEEGILETPDC